MAVDPRVETLRLLQSIDASLKALLAKQGGAAGPERVDLEGPHGDPIVKAKDPRDWTGEPMKGRHFSECPPDYLDMLAERFDYFASQEQDPKKAKYNRLDASRARGWALRIRQGGGGNPSAEDTGGVVGGEDWPAEDTTFSTSEW
jgi:hypothetical protein